METKYNEIEMNELGKQLGAPVSIERFGDREMELVHWTLEYELAALDALKKLAENGRPFRFSGHPSKWLLTALCLALKDNGVIMFIPVLNAEVAMNAFRIGSEPDGVSTYEMQESGEDIFVTYIFKDMKPDEMQQTIAPQLPAGKNIIIRATRHPILNAVCLAMAYAETCRSVWVTPDFDDDYCVCAITNTDAYALGETRSLT